MGSVDTAGKVFDDHGEVLKFIVITKGLEHFKLVAVSVSYHQLEAALASFKGAER